MYRDAIGRPKRDPFEALFGVLAAATRYDLALGIIPLAFAFALVGAQALGVSTVQALFVAAIVGVLVVADACYLNPPTDGESE